MIYYWDFVDWLHVNWCQLIQVVPHCQDILHKHKSCEYSKGLHNEAAASWPNIRKVLLFGLVSLIKGISTFMGY